MKIQPMFNSSKRYGRLWVAGVAVLLLQLAITSCKKAYTTPVVQEVYDLQFVGYEDSTITLEMTAIVKNDNSFGAVVEALHSKLYIKDTFIGNSSSKYGFKLKAHDTTHIVIDTQINIRSFSALYPELLALDSVLVKFDGLFDIGLPVTKKTVQMHKETHFNMPSKSLIVKQINDMLKNDESIKFLLPPKIKTLSSEETQLQLDVQITNAFPFAYEIQGMDMDIFMSGATTPSGHWTLADTIQMEAGQSKTTTVLVALQNQNLVQQALQNIMKGGIFDLKKATTVSAKGTVSVFVANYLFEIPLEIEKSTAELMK